MPHESRRSEPSVCQACAVLETEIVCETGQHRRGGDDERGARSEHGRPTHARVTRDVDIRSRSDHHARTLEASGVRERDLDRVGVRSNQPFDVIQADGFHSDEYLAWLRRWKALGVDLKNIGPTRSSRIRNPSFHGPIGHTL
jgi:hypothetical protein